MPNAKIGSALRGPKYPTGLSIFFNGWIGVEINPESRRTKGAPQRVTDGWNSRVLFSGLISSMGTLFFYEALLGLFAGCFGMSTSIR